MKSNLKKIFLVPIVLVVICLFISFLEYKHITHLNVFDQRLTDNVPMCGTFLELRKNILHDCSGFTEFMTNRPVPIDLMLTIVIFSFSLVLSFFYFLLKKSKKLFFRAFFIFVLIFLVMILIYRNIEDKDAFFLTGKLFITDPRLK